MAETLGEWVRLRQLHGDYVYVRAALICGVGETGGETGRVQRYVATLNGQTMLHLEEPESVVDALRQALAVERKLAR